MINRKVVRVIAIILVALLAGGAVVSALIGALALAEEAPAELPLDRQILTIEYLEDGQALQISQRLTYTNRTPDALESVLFYAAGNMFRRQSALMYEADGLEDVFPDGYVPAGMELRSARFDGEEADWGFQGEDELYLRVACDLAPGETGEFAFDYYLLLMSCAAFQGVGVEDVRAGAFYLAPGVYDADHHAFIVKKPMPFTRWLYCDAADFDVTLTLPDTFVPASTGTATLTDMQNHRATWRIAAEGVREFALSFGRRWRRSEAASDGGVRVIALTSGRDGGDVARRAARAVSLCEAWFGGYPVERLTLAQSDYPLDALNFPGLVWIPSALLETGERAALDQALRFCAAQQVFGMEACVELSADAWLSDSLCAYLSYLMLEEDEGREAFLKAVNRDWVSELQLTVPGGLRVTSDAMLFDGKSYGIVVRVRGAVVFHELRLAMGRDALLDGLAAFAQLGGPGHTLSEMDLVRALDESSGGDWEAFLTDWVFNVGEYVNQTIDWFE